MKKNYLVLLSVVIVLILVIGISYIYFPGTVPVGLPGKGKVTPECADHLDNDGDGYCDFSWKKAYCSDGSVLGDPDCLNKNDNSECATSTEICDNIDNDCDGLIDEDLVKECQVWCGTSLQYCNNGIWGECIDCNADSLTITYGPEINEVSVDYVRVYWETNYITPYAEVYLNDGTSGEAYQVSTEHLVTAIGLTPETPYEYKTKSCVDFERTICVESDYYPFSTKPYGTCDNNYKDDGETDVDCGGLTCPKCGSGQTCDSNSDCMSDYCLNGVCIDNSMCKELFTGTNNSEADRVNVVFIGLAYDSLNDFLDDARKAIDYYGNLDSYGPGLLELPVYRDNKNKFNFWYINDIFTPDTEVTSCTACRSIESFNYCTGLANSYKVNFCNISFRSCAYLGGSSYISVTGPSKTYWPYVFEHEFQHQFPQLRDEYVESFGRDRPGYPNCAADQEQAELWWGHLSGQSGEDGQEVGFYDGCSHVYGNYRPTISSIMRGWNWNLGLVNENYIALLLTDYSALLGEGENAVELTLTGSNPDDLTSYEVTGAKAVKYVNPLKTEKKKPYYIKVKVGSETFTQGFDTYEVLIEESFEDQKIALTDYKEIPLTEVKVLVPTGKYKLKERKINDKEFTIEVGKGNVKVKEIPYEKIEEHIAN